MKISLKNYAEIPEEQRNGIYEVENIGTSYYVNGNLHREEGPVIEYLNGSKWWYVNGKPHRIDGPAYESISGFTEYYIEG